jgi:hypothetical protein
VLNLMGFTGGTYTADVETWRLVEIGRAYLDLLDGKIVAGPGDTSFMPGSGEQEHAEAPAACGPAGGQDRGPPRA